MDNDIRKKQIKNLIITLLIFVIFYLIDQLTKYLATINLPYNEATEVGTTVEFIPYFLSFKLTYNRGIALGLFSNVPWLILLFTLLGTIILCYFCSFNDWKYAKLKSFSLTLALAGCVANFFDRFITIFNLFESKGVVDMIVWYQWDCFTEFFGMGKTIFNFADFILITAAILFIIDLLFLSERRKKKYEQNHHR